MFIKNAEAAILDIKSNPVNLFQELAAAQATEFGKISALDEGDPKRQNYSLYKRIAEKKPNILAFATRAISAHETYGPNKNGDAFERQELVDHHKSFVMQPHLMDHKMEIPYVRGIIAASYWRPLEKSGDGDYVETLILVNRDDFPKYASQVENGTINSFSMGVEVQEAECSHCGNIARNPRELCLLPKSPIVMEDGTVKNIEDVQVGDVVRTHTGAAKQVTEVFVRTISEDVVGLDLKGIQYPIWMTKNHPVLSAQWDKTDFVEAKDLTTESYIVFPKATYEVKDTETKEFAELFGWYLAEGWTNYKDTAKHHKPFGLMEFSLGQHEQDYVARILELGLKVWGVVGKVYNSKRSLGCSVRFYKENIGKRFYELGGGGALTKKLSLEVMSWSAELKRAVLTAFCLGDGTLNRKRGDITLYTASRNLSYQFSSMLRDMGVNNRIYSLLNTPGPTVRETGVRNLIYHVIMSSEQVEAFNAHVSPAFNMLRKKFIWAGTWYQPITNILGMFYTGPVYNIEVEDDHSYLVDGIAVHNCVHAEKMKNFTLQGKKVFEFNRGLNFIEQSAVVAPADVDSHTLYVLAHVKNSQHADVERLKKLSSILSGYSEDEKFERFAEFKLFESAAHILADRIAMDLGIDWRKIDRDLYK